MPEFHYIDLQENIINASLAEVANDTWLIYPTERSCKLALEQFQQNWQPLNVSFLSMDEFKQKVVFSNLVRLQDEKRLVCLYQSMTQEDRAIFHIEKYPDLIDWGQHFFSFFEELAEEGVEAGDLLRRMDALDFDFQPWQYDNYKRMMQIRGQYQSFITQKGYTDAIFDLELANIHLPNEIKRFVFVNQLYYTKLEKELLNAISDKKLQVVICFQGKREWLDEDSLTSKELNLDEAFPDDKLPFELKVIQSNTLWQMVLAFLQNQMNTENFKPDRHFIIDAKFCEQPYHTVFDQAHFQYTEPVSLHKTRLFHFWQILAKGLENLVFAEGKKLVKLDWLLQAVGMDGFMEYFRPDWNKQQQDNFVASLCRLSENDILYLDLELDVLKADSHLHIAEDCADLLLELMTLLKKLTKVSSIRQLVEQIDVDKGILIKDLLSEQEKICSNLQESFYEALANFMALDELALVDDWQSLYPDSDLAAGIFELFLTFLKPKTYKLFRQDITTACPILTNLMDTRNLQADKVSFLNLVEGELPSGRLAVWLFNERQRKAIGLKTWEDIRCWERYYYYRLLASASRVELYTVSNQDKDIEPSSFINEIYLFAQQKQETVDTFASNVFSTDEASVATVCLTDEASVATVLSQDQLIWQNSELPAQTLLLNWLQQDNENPLAQAAVLPVFELESWLNLPCDKQLDFGKEQQINLSWSACEHFIKSPFVYYLRDVAKLKERIVRLDETLNRKMFGNLMHRYLSVITQRLAEQHQGKLSMKWEWINKDWLTANLAHALAAPILFYQMPKNYNWEYVRELLSPFLVETARWFFQTGLAKDEEFQTDFITIIPETDSMTDVERQYKLLIKKEDTEQNIGIAIRGRADLRLETKEKRFIIDFKTGEADKLQLLFYVWSYYLIEQPELAAKVRSAIYKLMEKQLTWLDYEAKWTPAILPRTLKEALESIISDGYNPATDAKNKRYYLDITRADVLQKLALEEAENE